MVNEKDKCTIQGCREPMRARGYCMHHYNQAHILGEFGNEKCKLIDCDNFSTSMGYCSKHYRRMIRHGNPHTVILPNKRKERMDALPRRKGLERDELVSLGIDYSENDL